MNICVHLRHLRLVTRLTADYADERRWERCLLWGIRHRAAQVSAFRVFSVFRGSRVFAPSASLA
jgi:hypothetical protein